MKNKFMTLFKMLLDPTQEVQQTGTLPVEKQLQLATCALLLEMSKSDYSVTEEETNSILNALREAYKINDEELQMLKSAAEDELENSTSLRNFTTLINEHYSTQQKEEIIKLLWKVAHADGVIDRHESHLIRNLADLLYIPREHAMSLRG